MSKELYDKIDMASKWATPPEKPVVDQQAQSSIGLDWASRQQSRPAVEPPVLMKPIVPVAN